MCLAQARPRWARGVLEHPYLSDAQASAAAQAVSGRDHCQQRNEVEMTFRTSTLVSAMAEYYLRSDLPKTDTLSLNKALASLPARNASEDFGLCVASHNPAAARALALSEPGSSTEASSAQEMHEAVVTCTARGEALKVDLQSLRALVTIALYRGVVAILGV
jgi:hypothetical protein